MSAILAVCGDTFCAMVSDGRYVEEPITGEKPHILKNDLPKVRKINRNVVVGFAGDTLAAVQIINAVDEYQTQYLTLEKVVKILREKLTAAEHDHLGTRRLLRAFPDMKSLNYADTLAATRAAMLRLRELAAAAKDAARETAANAKEKIKKA